MSRAGEVIILHLSDLHRTPGYEVNNNNLWKTLRHDIYTEFTNTNSWLAPNDPKLPQPTEIALIIVSGDITQKAAPNEYQQAAEFLNFLVENLLNNDKTRLILVPGNHDVDWGYSRGAYTEAQQSTPDTVRTTSLQESAFRFQVSNNGTTRVLMQRHREDIYQERFKAFAEFFSSFYKVSGEYEFNLKDRAKQYTVYDNFTETLNIVVVGFNSCDLVDHLWYRGAINLDAIINAASDLESKNYPVKGGPLRLAVWHHNVLGSPSQSDWE